MSRITDMVSHNWSAAAGGASSLTSSLVMNVSNRLMVSMG
jgi:hypothetical protein